MERPAHPGWRFLPGAGAVPGAGEIAAAAAAGRGALSGLLRAMRLRIGAPRTASLLRAAEAMSGRRFGRTVRLRLVASVQPRSVADGLAVAFAAAGLALDLVATDGLSALGEALEGPGASPAGDVDVTLLCLPMRERGGEGAPGGAATIESLAGAIAARSRVPVAIADFGAAAEDSASSIERGVSRLVVPLGPAPLFDERFGDSFGAILSRPAADGLADAAAGFAARLEGTSPKLLITDLDGVLWSGLLGEEETGQPSVDAAPGPAPAFNHALVAALWRLRRRGLVLAIASRNDPADVDRALSGEGSPIAAADFAARAVGWEDKATLVARVLGDLGLSAEHAVFLDDDPVNCAKVAARFPDMDVRRVAGDADVFAGELLADPLLFGGGAERSEEAAGAERSEQYRRRAEVERLRAASPDIAAFLEGLGTRVTVLPLDRATIPRAVELAARVNQFRFTDLRPNALDLAARRTGLDFLLRLDDAFGPHGLVGLVLASREGEAARIDTLLLSCRALERGIEGAMLEALARLAQASGVRRLVGRIEALPRNEPARDCLERHGFVRESEDWVHALETSRPRAMMTAGVTMVFGDGLFDPQRLAPHPLDSGREAKA